MALTSASTILVFEKKCEVCQNTMTFDISLEHTNTGWSTNEDELNKKIREKIDKIVQIKEYNPEMEKCPKCGFLQSFAWHQGGDGLTGIGCLISIILGVLLSIIFSKLIYLIFHSKNWIGIIIGILAALIFFFIYSTKTHEYTTKRNERKYMHILMKMGLIINENSLSEIEKIISKQVAEKLKPLKGIDFKTENELKKAINNLEDGNNLFTSYYDLILRAALKKTYPVFIKMKHPRS